MKLAFAIAIAFLGAVATLPLLKRTDDATVAADHSFARSVTTFAYDERRSGIAQTSLADGTQFRSMLVPFPAGRHAAKFMPLYLDSGAVRARPSDPRRLLIFFVSSPDLRLRLYDLDRDSVFRDITLPLRLSPASAPVIDPRSKTLYYLSFVIDPALGRSRYFHRLIQISLETFETRIVEFEPASPVGRLHCKTALALSSEDRRLAWGCSVAVNAERAWTYAKDRGLSGLVMSMDLAENGDLQPNSLRAFVTSRVGTVGPGGYDTGVYLAGGALARSATKDWLVATGNGPWLPEQGAFGCAVFRLSQGLENVPLTSRGPAAVGLNAPHHNECWQLNDELTSSAVSLGGNPGAEIASVMSKSGRLLSFEIARMDPNVRPVSISLGQGRWSYGQPVSWTLPSGAVRVFATAFDDGFPSHEVRWQHAVGGDGASTSCLGYTAIARQAGGVELVAFDSGPLRGDHLTLPSDHPFFPEITQPFTSLLGAGPGSHLAPALFGPYRATGSLGWTLDPHAKPPSGFRLDPLPDPRETFSPELRTRAREITGAARWILAPASGKARVRCPPAPEGYQALHRISSFAPERTAQVRVGGIELAPGGSVRTLWTIIPAPGLRLDRTHSLVLLKSPRSERTLLLLTGYSIDEVSGRRQSRIFLHDAARGTRLHEASFQGVQHFSMPLVVGNEVFLATQEDGLNRLRIGIAL